MGENCWFCLVKVAKRPGVARARSGKLGQGWACFWVRRDGSSGGACLDICRYLQLSHQASNTPQSLRRADLQISAESMKINENQWIWRLRVARGRLGRLGGAWARSGTLLSDGERQQWRSLSRYLQISAVISSSIQHAPKPSAGGFADICRINENQ